MKSLRFRLGRWADDEKGKIVKIAFLNIMSRV